jgi:hypothetical protein
MPSDGTIGGLVGRLDVLRIECPTCGQQGRYQVARPCCACPRRSHLVQTTLSARIVAIRRPSGQADEKTVEPR